MNDALETRKEDPRAGRARPIRRRRSKKGSTSWNCSAAAKAALSQKEIAQRLGRSVGELYRMVTSLVERGYVVSVDDRFHVTTKLFELAHINPPTHRLLTEAMPLMQKLSDDLDQSCHLTVYNQGRQIVVAKVDNPSGMGFSLRVGAELDVLVSASGRVLLAFQDRRNTADAHRGIRSTAGLIMPILKSGRCWIRFGRAALNHSRAFRYGDCTPSAFPILDSQGHAIASLTVPYAERIDQEHRKSIPIVEETLGLAAHTLSIRMGGAGSR